MLRHSTSVSPSGRNSFSPGSGDGVDRTKGIVVDDGDVMNAPKMSDSSRTFSSSPSRRKQRRQGGAAVLAWDRCCWIFLIVNAILLVVTLIVYHSGGNGGNNTAPSSSYTFTKKSSTRNQQQQQQHQTTAQGKVRSNTAKQQQQQQQETQSQGNHEDDDLASSSSQVPMELDQEGNNRTSPYYTDLDEYHDPTHPGRDWLIRKINVSAPLYVDTPSVQAKLQQSHNPQSGPLETLVVIVGAGTAGLAAARQLQEDHGIHNYIIVEATSQSGGRVRKDVDYLNYNEYPIDLGAAVVHRPDLIEDYADQRYQRQLLLRNKNPPPPRQHFEYIQMPNGEVTFYNYSFADWVLDYVAPVDHKRSTLYDCVVQSVTAYGNRVLTKCRPGGGNPEENPIYIESRYVIMTASLQVLRDETITFTPPLPSYLIQDYNAVMWRGLKVFLSFSKNFFRGEAFCLFHCPFNEGRSGELEDGESFFWDHGLDFTGQSVITGFIMGEAYKHLEDLNDEQRLHTFLQAIDEKFDGQASQYYTKHYLMDWTAENYQRGTYSSHGLEGPHIVHGGQLLFAGEAWSVTEDGQGWVHGALLSGETAADYVTSNWNHIVKDCGSYSGCKLTNGRKRKSQLKETNVAVIPTKKGLKFYDTHEAEE